ncbi:MAG: hypothetical protein QG673_1095 [Pseudomonadota bacterium]|nr:hypothetical protein [Pseudomonadota bacterium]
MYECAPSLIIYSATQLKPEHTLIQKCSLGILYEYLNQLLFLIWVAFCQFPVIPSIKVNFFAKYL